MKHPRAALLATLLATAACSHKEPVREAAPVVETSYPVIVSGAAALARARAANASPAKLIGSCWMEPLVEEGAPAHCTEYFVGRADLREQYCKLMLGGEFHAGVACEPGGRVDACTYAGYRTFRYTSVKPPGYPTDCGATGRSTPPRDDTPSTWTDVICHAEGRCDVFRAGSTTEESEAARRCADQGGKVSSEPCAESGVVGGCIKLSETLYYSPRYDAESAREDCGAAFVKLSR